MKNRKGISWYLYFHSDRREMEVAKILLEDSLRALMNKIKLANDGAERRNNITQE